MSWLKQSTAASCIVGPILDSTGAEYASAVIGDLSLSKNGGTLTALASAATLTYIANGMYTLALTTGNTDTLGRAEISCNKSTYQMPQKVLMVLPATVFDALVTNATNSTGGLIAATAAVSAAAGYIGASGAAINGTNVNTLSSHDPGATLGTSTYAGADTSGTTTLLTRIVGTLAAGTHNPQTGDTYTLASGASGFAAIAGYLDTEISGLVTDMATVLSRLSAARAGYLDKLNISGNVAASSEVTAIQNNTTTSLIAPANILRPAVGTLTAKIVVYLTDEIGNMEAPDSAPTLSVYNAAGANLTARLSSATGTLTTTGVYTWDYTSTSTDDAEELLFTVTVIEGGITRYKGVTSWITDNATTDFTSSDRADLLLIKGYVDELETRLTAIRAGYLDNLSGGAVMLASSYTAPDNSTIGTVNTKLGTPVVSVSADIATVKSDTSATLLNTNELQSDWANGGRLDLILDARSSQASVDDLQTTVDGIAVETGYLVAATGTVQDLAGSTTSFKTSLTADDDTYNDQLLHFTSGSLAKQAKPILSYAITDGVVTFDEGFTTAPSNGDQFAILVDHIHPVTQIQSGLATQTSVDALPSSSNIIDAMTGDSITPAKAFEMLSAFMSGVVSASSASGITTYTYKRRDGATTSFTSVCSEENGTRATTGTIP